MNPQLSFGFMSRQMTFIKQPSLLYQHFGNSRFKSYGIDLARDAQEFDFNSKFNAIVMSLMQELGYDFLKHQQLLNLIMISFREESMQQVPDKIRTQFNDFILLIKELYKYENGDIVRQIPVSHGIYPTDESSQVRFEVLAEQDAKLGVTMSYEEKIERVAQGIPIEQNSVVQFFLQKDNMEGPHSILSDKFHKKNNRQQDMTLFLYENKLLDYYQMNYYIVHKREVINMRHNVLSRFKPTIMPNMVFQQQNLFYNLEKKDFLSLRLVNKAMYHSSIENKMSYLAQEVFDIFFMWVRAQYGDLRLHFYAAQQYPVMRKYFLQFYNKLLIARRYARFRKVEIDAYDTLGEESLLCDIHNNFRCTLCNVDKREHHQQYPLYGYEFKHSQVGVFINNLINQKLVSLKKCREIIRSTIVMFRDEHLLSIIYTYMIMNAKVNKTIPEWCMKIFRKYLRHFAYFRFMYDSVIGMYKANEVPMWFDFLKRDDIFVYRKPYGKFIPYTSPEISRGKGVEIYDFRIKAIVPKYKLREFVSPHFDSEGGLDLNAYQRNSHDPQISDGELHFLFYQDMMKLYTAQVRQSQVGIYQQHTLSAMNATIDRLSRDINNPQSLRHHDLEQYDYYDNKDRSEDKVKKKEDKS